MNQPYNVFASAIIHLLEELEIDYGIGGSFASSLYGESRSSVDIDISVVVPKEKFEPLTQAVEKLGYYVTWDAILDAIIWKTPFNIIDSTTGFKADLFLVEGTTPLEQSVFQRRQRLIYDPRTGDSAMLYSPEDVIIYKLKWYLEGRMEKHPNDIVKMLVAQRGALDLEYIAYWANEIGAAKVWEIILADYYRRFDSKT